MKIKYTVCCIICVMVFSITCNNFAATSYINTNHIVTTEQVSFHSTFKKNYIREQSAASAIMPPIYGLLLRHVICDNRYRYSSNVEDLYNGCYKKTYVRKHCDGDFHYQLTDTSYASIGGYCGPQKEISYHIGNNDTDIIIKDIYESAMPIGTSYLLTYTVDNDLKMSCNLNDFGGPTLKEKVFQEAQLTWVETDYLNWDKCVDAFKAKLPDPPPSMYVPGNCHEWWDHFDDEGNWVTCNP